jgi:hypothetical protein
VFSISAFGRHKLQPVYSILATPLGSPEFATTGNGDNKNSVPKADIKILGNKKIFYL